MPEPESPDSAERASAAPVTDAEPSLPVRAFRRLGVVGAPALGAAALATLFDGAWRLVDFGGLKVVAGLLHGALLFGLLGFARATGGGPLRSRVIGAVGGLISGLTGALVFYLSFSVLRWEEPAGPELFLISVLLAWVTVWLGLGLTGVRRGELGRALVGGLVAGLISIPGVAVIALIWTGLLRSFPSPLQVALELPAWWLCFTPALAVLSAPADETRGHVALARQETS